MSIRHPIYAEEDGKLKLKCPNGRPVIADWKITYEGCVLSTYERNGYDDSDFYAVVWDEATKSIKDVEYATTRFYTYDCSASIDATEETLAKVEAFLFARNLQYMTARAEDKAKAIRFGDLVRVVKGRKVPIGTEGEICWEGQERKYGYPNRDVDYGRAMAASVGVFLPSTTKMRYGIRLKDGPRVYTAGTNLELLTDWKARMEPAVEIDRCARAHAKDTVEGYRQSSALTAASRKAVA